MKLQKFYEWLQLNKNSKKTIDGYYQRINCFGKFCNYEFNQSNLDKYIIKLKEENKSPSTINAFLIGIRVYCKYAEIKNLKIPVPKRVKRGAIKFYFTEKDMQNVYKHLTLINGDYKLKELILRFMFYTGVRPSELINLKTVDINFDKKDVNIFGAKGNKDRVIPILNDKLFGDLKDHCNQQEEKVFDISYFQINYLLKQIKNVLQLDGVIEPRTMRISFAKYCLSVGMDIAYLKKLMGHTDIKVTEIYAEPDERLVKETCEKIRKGIMK